jgi:large subunit ribosomal protein L15
MARKDRKIRRLRGTRTIGFGQVGQHRKGGMKGGRGKAGGLGTKLTYTVKYDPDRFGKHGFKNPRTIGLKITVLNVGVLSESIKHLISNGDAEEKEGKIHVNLIKLGYKKLLGSGKVTHPLIVRVETVSDNAKKKIEEAGGAIINKE